MLTHGGLIAVTRGLGFIGLEALTTDCHISYLPLAHVYERCVVTHVMLRGILYTNCFLTKGGRIGFFRGDISLLIDDISVLQPTIFPSVIQNCFL